ncbi:hypothetical protein F383_24582 [Gossypium arboreum]|uniref:Uncharacterized protein n=1 Tax=Gossypium arboreum TaxID=29729 RepID=A0A0B0MQQ4_GOSAR|nr:hypothetical protein F383_24582 [Gossypium arboreum]
MILTWVTRPITRPCV